MPLSLVFQDWRFHVPPGSHLYFLVGGWTNPFQKYARQIGSFPQNRGENKNIWNHQPVIFCIPFPHSKPLCIVKYSSRKKNKRTFSGKSNDDSQHSTHSTISTKGPLYYHPKQCTKGNPSKITIYLQVWSPSNGYWMILVNFKFKCKAAVVSSQRSCTFHGKVPLFPWRSNWSYSNKSNLVHPKCLVGVG